MSTTPAVRNNSDDLVGQYLPLDGAPEAQDMEGRLPVADAIGHVADARPLTEREVSLLNDQEWLCTGMSLERAAQITGCILVCLGVNAGAGLACLGTPC
jgi:hypothetical protein